MRVGLFNERITFQKLNENSKDSSGFPLPDYQKWTDFKTVWAMIKTTRLGRETHEAGTTIGEITVRFVIRYQKTIKEIDTKNYRIKHKGRFYDIISPPINDDFKNTTLTILAKEVI